MTNSTKYCLFTVLLSVCLSAKSQDPRVAQEVFKMGNYFEAIEQYLRLLEKEPNNVEYNANLGVSYLRTNIEPTKALDHLLKVEKLGNFKNQIYLEIARAYMYHLQYDQALIYLNKYRQAEKPKKKDLENYQRHVANCHAALDLMKYPVKVSFKNLGPELNSEYADYHPFLSKDGTRIYFTSRRKVRPGSRPEFDGYYPSDIYSSEFGDYGKWEKAERLGDRINTIYDEQTVGINRTGDSLFFYIDHVGDFGDIFLTTTDNGIFSKPQRVTEINTEAVESACSVSANGKRMIFSSNRDGGQGGMDIWMTNKQPNGSWDEPVNLGPEVNSAFHEDFPSLSPDGKTLYFCSNGHAGMGGYDLFFSTWDEDSQIWTKPQNLGFPVNGPGDDKNISFITEGKTAVIAKLRDGGLGDLDLYEMTYERDIDDTDPAIFLINVRADDALSKPLLQIKNEYDELVGEYKPNNITGKYTLALYPGKYFMYVDAKGYTPYNEVLVVNNFHTRQDQNVKLIKLKK